MIVANTNTIAYLYLPTKFTRSVETLLEKEPVWVAPILWRSELRNILSLYIRKEIVDLESACNIQIEAENLTGENEFTVGSTSVLTLAQSSGCTAYDCEFVSLAITLGINFVTEDKKLLKTFPDTAHTALQYTATLL